MEKKPKKPNQRDVNPYQCKGDQSLLYCGDFIHVFMKFYQDIQNGYQLNMACTRFVLEKTNTRLDTSSCHDDLLCQIIFKSHYA